MPRRNDNLAALLPNPPLLITESADELNRIRSALIADIKPSGIIDLAYVVDFATLVLEAKRVQRWKVAIINAAFSNALITVFSALLMHLGFDPLEGHRAAKALVLDWFANPTKKENAAKVLALFKLDESAIEAEAFKQSASEVERLDRMLASLESRRNKVLRGIAEYRGGLARQLKESSDRIIEGEVVNDENSSTNKPSAAA